MTIKEAMGLYSAINSGMFKNLKGTKFSYALLRSQSILKNELSMLEKSFSISPEFEKYDGERIELMKKYADTYEDDKGKKQFVIENNMFKFSEKNEKTVLEELTKLKKNYKKVIDDRENQEKEFEKLLQTEAPFGIHSIPLEDFPQDVTPEQMEVLLPLIKEG